MLAALARVNSGLGAPKMGKAYFTKLRHRDAAMDKDAQMHRPHPLSALALLLMLAACQQGKQAALNPDEQNLMAGNVTDPALVAALEDQIMVDPQLVGQSNRTAVKPGAQPLRGAVPAPGGGGAGKVEPGAALAGKAMKAPPPARTGPAAPAMTIGQRAAFQARRSHGNCDPKVAYGAGWATRLPIEFPIFPRGELLEAAGSDSAGCALRVVSFTTDAPVPDIVDYYYTRARRAGFDAERVREGNADILAGTRGDDAYYIILNARQGGGSDVDLVVNNGKR